ncbi:MAG: hypothetical protein ABSC47_03715 [Terracidiphilus sp.]|jgi:hypothetical protein
MTNDSANRRSFLKTLGAAGMMSAIPEEVLQPHWNTERVVCEVASPSFDLDTKPQYAIKFAVIGLDHNHILGITAALIRGGGELVKFHSTLPRESAAFQALYPNARLAKSEEEILDDPSIPLIAGAPIPNLRAP